MLTLLKIKAVVKNQRMFRFFAKYICFLCSQELERLGLGEAVDLHVCEVPVEYQAVQILLPSLWKEHQPQVFKKIHWSLQKNKNFHHTIAP